MSLPEFVGFPKIKRWSRDIIITEKIDGTNAGILIGDGPFTAGSGRKVPFLCSSKNRWIFPENDNQGFAKWAYENAEALLRLGPGHHFGEWWGQKIGRVYDLAERRFSLFNVSRYTPEKLEELNAGLEKQVFYAVPKLYEGPNVESAILEALEALKVHGSVAAPGFSRPEGVVIFHTAGNFMLKKTLENDEMSKGEAEFLKKEARKTL